jgi:phospholipase C
LYAFADEYALCERWFASVMGPTWPNRFYLHAGTSNGMMGNSSVELRSIWNQLEEAGVSATYYYSGLPFVLTFGKTTGNKRIADFYADARAGTLPHVCYVDPVLTTLGPGNDDHPPADIRDGQAFLASVYDALAQSPQWDKCLLVITYDEHGGFYDHVPPPTTTDDLEEFRQLGFRVPSVVIGPQVKQGFRCTTVLDHTSVVATITRRFGFEPLTRRVAEASDLSVVLDPALAMAPRPPIDLPTVELPQQLLIPPVGSVRGQLELAAFLEREYALDWRVESERGLRVVREQALRLGSARITRRTP